MLDFFVDMIFPRKCIICQDVIPLGYKDKYICRNCENNIPYIRGKTCSKCGKPIPDKNDEKYCIECIGKHRAFEKCYAVFSYDDIKESIKRFKFYNVENLGIGLSNLMFEYAKSNFYDEFLSFDYLIPIPIHETRRKERGFNQTEVLVSELSKLSSVPCSNNILLRHKMTKPQNNLTPQERKDNIKGAFFVNDKERIQDKKILIVDDIFTTGSTAEEASKELYKNGAGLVSVFTLSIT